jgi:predicted transcriptional regulator
MNGKRRDKLEIMGCILSLCKQKDTTKTKIVYQSNLNFKTAGMYLSWLINSGMVAKEENCFKLTARGIELLSSLNEMSPLFNERFEFKSHLETITERQGEKNQRGFAVLSEETPIEGKLNL